MNTGEGKTYIIASLAVLIILMSGKKESTWVDIITSSSVLAQRDCEEMQGFYKSFGISASDCSQSGIFQRRDNFKIFDSVVIPLMVNMVHNFPSRNIHQKTVKIHSLTVNARLYITVSWVDTPKIIHYIC